MTSNTKNNIPDYIQSAFSNHPLWLEFLKLSSGSALFTHTAENSKIMIAAPHHAPRHTSRMVCDRNADENAGYLACALAEKLNASLIVACHYFHDPNKFENSDYFRFIEANAPQILIEIHGHGAKSALHDIEISSGPYDKKYAADFAESLSKNLTNDEELSKLTISGDYSKIFFTAQYSITITDNRWHSLHIELPPALRKAKNSIYPPEAGFRFMDYISSLLKK